MWISYNDSEVNVYHPLCEEALNKAIATLDLSRIYEVLHHQYTGSLEMDYAIRNKRTGKYLCVIEVKRTPADVHSARYQYQAMSYVQMNAAVTERPFYILTNLEYAFAFRYDAARPRVFQQMLAPGLHTIGCFADYETREEYVDILAEFFVSRIQAYINDRYSYLITLERFAFYMEAIKEQPKKWKSGLAVLLYEYIRGAFTCVSRNELHDVRLFRAMTESDVIRICNEAAHINFKEIFDYSDERYVPRIYVENNLLSNIFDFGHQNINGNSVADVLHQIVSEGREHDGEVPTDLELGRVVAVLAHNISGDISTSEKVCDPAAGSGNLLSSAIDIFNLTANQIVANDINPQLGELLTLRLGLNFVQVVGGDVYPLVSHSNIVDLETSFFDDVKVVVLNPPFLGGVYAAQRKQAFYSRINELAGRDTGNNIGQMPLEAAFLELVTYLVKPGTTIACIFPKSHLLARGPEAQAMRRLMIRNLGIHTIFTYPGKDIFVDVTRDTCVLVGKAMQPADNISLISSYETIPNLDLHTFAESLGTTLSDEFSPMCAGVVGKKIPKERLMTSVIDGWREINSEMLDALSFVDFTFRENDAFRLIENCDWRMKRGGAANSGGSDILFFDSRRDLYSAFLTRDLTLKAGMRNAELDTFIANEGDSKFLDSSEISEDLLEDIIDCYLRLPVREGRQARNTKTKDQWIKIVNKESRGKFAPYSVLIPRALRRKGRVHLIQNDIFVSTNFLVCYGLDERTSLLLGTWISTIFYQLICEVSSKDQEGMRKMEVRDIAQTVVPVFENITDRTYDRLKEVANNIEFLDLQEPIVRDVDMIWAEELFGEEAEQRTSEARRLLEYTATRRNS